MALPLPNAETQARVVSEAAQNFIDHYYESLNRRHGLANYYASTSPLLTAASVTPDISINGRHLGDGPGAAQEYEALLNTQGGPVAYEIASFDAQSVNANFCIGCPESLGGSSGASGTAAGESGGASAGGSSGSSSKVQKSIKDGDRVSFALQVSGTVRYGRPGEDGAEDKAFNESWVLVPHWEALSPKAARGLRRWVVVSQNFRVL
ncbi:Uu.00g086520.m01.CDS01 [Anthostomella pinea]|uniref:Uu.00g086520.m01.CDS01 n=1 Tax=Anthostomella pinea TaxID=933095 RepID=A0AAI8VN35_9PEZI|nr:Uu.00g086520.m01.CDS01 [Anthostomella pinea]